jgi:hypothetical protein
MFEVSVGHSIELEPDRAIAEVVEQCRGELDGATPRAGIVYSAAHRDHEYILEQLADAFPETRLMGCSTDGEASSAKQFEEDSLVLTLFASDQVEFGVGLGEHADTQVGEAARQAVEEARAGMSAEPKLCITTPESMGTNGVSIVDALRDELGAEFPILGGVAAHQGLDEETYQFAGTGVYQNALPVLLMGGDDLTFSHGYASGWQPIGQRHTVREAEDNVVRTIDEWTAVDFYRRYLGEEAEISPQHPLAVFEDGDENFYLRAPASWDEETGAVTFFGDVPAGSEIQVTRAPRRAILEGTEESIQNAIDEFPGQDPDAALFFSCNSRNHLLGTSVDEEIGTFESMFDDEVPVSGFYALGEISPLERDGVTRFHNESFISLLLGTK